MAKMYAWINSTAHSDPRCKAAGAALGLWGRALSWCAANSPQGRVPRSVALELGSEDEVAALLRVGLWVELGDGYQFTPSDLLAISPNNPDDHDAP